MNPLSSGSAARCGVWIAGAKGDIAATVIVGARAIERGLASTTGLTSSLAPLDRLPLPAIGDLVFGGADISQRALRESARSLYANSQTISRELLDEVSPDLDAIDKDILVAPELSWTPVPGKAGQSLLKDNLQRLRAAISAFRRKHRLERIVVVNLTSAEPEPKPAVEHNSIEGLESLIEADRRDAVSPCMLFAYAALAEKCAFINFSPNVGTTLGCTRAMAKRQGMPFYGDDGKTGETLVKTVLAPMFAARNLRVLSWEGVNMLGNNDGKSLSVPENRAPKLRNKRNVLHSMLGYDPHGEVHINYVPSLGDWKTAWDLIHFQGFLDVKMTMQFTWQGCDSILAAPLVLDLARLADLALQRGESGPMRHLAAFFKNPFDVDEMALWPQFERLTRYAEERLEQSGGGQFVDGRA
jgi:myo-inositol-1-phosphate synthase